MLNRWAPGGACACLWLAARLRRDRVGGAALSRAESFRTERVKRDKIVRAATMKTEGLADRNFQCANCKAQRTERIGELRSAKVRGARISCSK